MIAANLALLLPSGRADNGSWLGAPSNTAYSNTSAWLGGTVADGIDATATFVYDPLADGDGTNGGNIAFDAPRTLGNIVFEDLNGFGSASIIFTAGGGAQNLTLDVTTGTPTITAGQLLNAQSGGKKVVINHNFVGTDGLLKNGPGYLAIRTGTANTISGTFTIEGGLLEQRAAMPSISAVVLRSGATLQLDFANAGTSSIDRFAPTTPLTLGGPGGGGVVVNTNAAATTSHSQTFGGVTVAPGASQIVANTNTGQDMAYVLGPVSQAAGGGGTLNLAKPTANGVGTFTVSNAPGLLGAWATFANANFAEVGPTGQIAAFAGYTNNLAGTGLHTDITRSLTLANQTMASLRFNTGHASRLTLSGTNVIESGGVIVAQQAPIVTGGTLTSGQANGDLYFHSNAGGVGGRIQSTIANNGATPVRVIKALGGVLSLENDMTYTGGTIVGAGQLILGSGLLGGSTGSVLGDIVLSANSTATGSYNPTGSILAFNRSGTYTVPNNINPAVYGAGTIAQFSPGTLVLNKPSKVSGLLAQAGTTRLDFNAPSAPATQLIDGTFVTGPTTLHTARLTLRNGDVELTGKDGAATQQNFALTDLQGFSRITLTPGAGGTTSLHLGALTRPEASNDGGGVIDLVAPVGTDVFSAGGAANTIVSENGTATMIMNGEWAARDASGSRIVPGSSIAGFYTPTSGGLAGNADVNAPVNATFDTTLSSLRFNAPGGLAVTVDAGAILEPRGVLVTTNAGATAVRINGPGNLRAQTGNQTGTATSARDLPFIQNNQAAELVVSAPIVNFDANNRTSISKHGPGTLTFENVAHTYTDRTFISGGVLKLGLDAGIGSSGARAGSVFARSGELVLQNNAQLFTGAFTSIGQRTGDEGILTVRDTAVYDVAADFNIGDVNARGTLNIQNDAILTVRSLFVGKFGFANGTVNQTGGSLFAGNTPAADWMIGGQNGADNPATGVFNLNAGVFDSGNQNFQVGRHGTGTLNQTGGSYSGTGFIVVGRFHSGVGTWNLSGGTIDVTTTVSPGIVGAAKEFFIIGEAGVGSLNVSGTGSVRARSLSLAHNGGVGAVTITGGTIDLTEIVPLANGVQPGIVFSPGTTAPNPFLPGGASGVVTLSGGTVKAFGVSERSGALVTSTVNFNGGTLQGIADNPTFLQGIDNANVQGGGAVIDSGGFNLTVAQNLLHDAALGAAPDGGLSTKGGGTLTFIGANNYTGATTVGAGSVFVNGSITATSAVAVKAGGTLGGSGNIATGVAGDINLEGAGKLAPGGVAGAVGTLVVTLGAGGELDLSLGVTAANSQALLFDLDTNPTGDLITLNSGVLNIGSGVLEFDDFAFNALAGFGPGTYTLFATNSPIVGLFGGDVDGTINGFDATLARSGDGTDLILVAVPEPRTWLLAGGGILALVCGQRRRHPVKTWRGD